MERLLALIQDFREEVPGYESNTTAIVNALLDLSGITYSNGYIIKDEVLLGSITSTVPEEFRNLKPDKVIFKDTPRTQTTFIQVMRSANRNPLMVIECKHMQTHTEFTIDSIRQIKGYMLLSNIPIGLLISEYSAIFYVCKNSDVVEMGDGVFHDIMDSLNELINKLKESVR